MSGWESVGSVDTADDAAKMYRSTQYVAPFAGGTGDYGATDSGALDSKQAGQRSWMFSALVKPFCCCCRWDPGSCFTFIDVPITRIAGVGYLLLIILAMFAEVGVRSALIVAGDASATAANIRSNPLWFKCGFLADIGAFACDVLVNGALYLLLYEFGGASAFAATLAMLFRVVQAAVLAVNTCLLWFAFLCASPPRYLSKAFNAEQLDALVLLSLDMHKIGYSLAMCFFALNCGLTGWLLYRSPIFSWWLGILLGAAAVAYVWDSMSSFFIAGYDTPVVLAVILVASEFSLCGYLLVKGILC